MTYDLDFRYRRALEPAGLNTVSTCLAALNEAVADARYAGIMADHDPAVTLLARRLGRVAAGDTAVHEDSDDDLRHECVDRLSLLERNPAIISLVTCGVGNDRHSLAAFRREGNRTLRKLAIALGLDRSQSDIRYTAHRADLAGDHELTGGGAYVRLSGQSWLAETAIAYRSSEWAIPGDRVRHLPIAAVADMADLARRIRTDLGLPQLPQLQLI